MSSSDDSNSEERRGESPSDRAAITGKAMAAEPPTAGQQAEDFLNSLATMPEPLLPPGMPPGWPPQAEDTRSGAEDDEDGIAGRNLPVPNEGGARGAGPPPEGGEGAQSAPPRGGGVRSASRREAGARSAPPERGGRKNRKTKKIEGGGREKLRPFLKRAFAPRLKSKKHIL